jgi:hypothetical protein
MAPRHVDLLPPGISVATEFFSRNVGRLASQSTYR